MGVFTSREASFLPALLRCDGHYELRDAGSADQLVDWCGWFRFEGNGGCVCKQSVEHVPQLRGEWSAVDNESVRVSLPPSALPTVPTSILIREGPDVDTVFVVHGEDHQEALFAFVPEEEEDHGGPATSSSGQPRH